MAESGPSRGSWKGGKTAEPAADETVFETESGPFTRGWYWSIFAFSTASLVVLWIFYQDVRLWYVQFLYWVAQAMAAGILIWSGIGLLTRYRVMQRLGASAARLREGGEQLPEEEIVYRENLLVRLFKLVGRLVALLFLFVWNTVFRIVYIVEITVLQLLILGYDLIYYATYMAWATSYHVLRLALRIAGLALRIVWKVLRLLTKLPLAHWLWPKRMRPSILGKYNHRVEHYRQRHALYVDRKRRLAALAGKDPDEWQRDWDARHRFPLPHPHEARKGLRERIEMRRKIDFNRRDRWRAYRKGLSIPPKLHIGRPEETEVHETSKGRPEPRAGRRSKTASRRGPRQGKPSAAVPTTHDE